MKKLTLIALSLLSLIASPISSHPIGSGSFISAKKASTSDQNWYILGATFVIAAIGLVVINLDKGSDAVKD